jgi:hypothetical protein
MENLQKIKKALFLENEFFDTMKGFYIYDVYEYLTHKGVNCVVIDQASGNKEQVGKEAIDSDAIFFASTFLYESEVKSVGNLLKALPSKLIYGQSIGSGSLQSNIEKLWELDEILAFSHHRIFEITENIKFTEEGETFGEEISMSEYHEEKEKLEKERIERNQGFRKTGRMVRIKEIKASGPQWGNLKEGDVVQELDCSSIDPNPKRGVWVMGVDEPVKLLNDSGYEEWEYSGFTSGELAREFFSRGSMLHQTELMGLVQQWIRNCSGSMKLSDAELWEWCDNLCNTLNLERRGNRRYFERRLQEHRKNYVYFKESI